MELQHVPELATVDFTRLKAHVLYWSTFTPVRERLRVPLYIGDRQAAIPGRFRSRCRANPGDTAPFIRANSTLLCNVDHLGQQIPLHC